MANRLKTIQGETNPILTKFAVGYASLQRFIARKVAPVIESLTESGTLYTFGKEGFMLYDTERSMRANAQKIDFAVSKDTYRCVEHALESSLDYRELEAAEKYGAQKVLSLKKRALNIVSRALDVELEKAVADILFSGTYYATGNKTTLTGTDQWSHASSDPITQLSDGKAAARADMGIVPNALVLGYDSYDQLCKHASIKAMFTDMRYKPVLFSAADLAAILKFQYVFVGQAVYSTDAGVFTDLWSDNAALIYLPEKSEDAEGTTPHTVIIDEAGYPEVKEYPNKKTIDIEATRKYVVKNISTSYGYLIVDTKL